MSPAKNLTTKDTKHTKAIEPQNPPWFFTLPRALQPRMNTDKHGYLTGSRIRVHPCPSVVLPAHPARRRRSDHPRPVSALRLPPSAFPFVFLFLSVPLGTRADIHYVNVNSASPLAPYTNWATAATVIQEAVEAATDGDTVLVTNGVYDAGGRVFSVGYSALTNRVAITNAITLQSVNGPAVTLIHGKGPLGDSAVRCVYFGTNAVLAGFTLTNGATRATSSTSEDRYGGGLFCKSQSGRPTVSNCIISGNSATRGGGAYGMITLQHCTISGNSSRDSGGGTSGCTLENSAILGNAAVSGGGGSYNGNLQNCTVLGNTGGGSGGGINDCQVKNSIVYHNIAHSGADNWANCSLIASCTTPLPPGTGNITNAPGVLGLSNPRLVLASSCIDAGTNAYATGATDLEGDSRILGARIEIGCDEVPPAGMSGALTVAITAQFRTAVVNAPLSITAAIGGSANGFAWDFGDGTRTTNHTIEAHAWRTPGTYAVLLQAWNNDTTCSNAVAVTILPSMTNYVSPAGGHVTPYTDWSAAATNIQAAIDVVAVGGVVIVSNGVYQAGGSSIYGNIINRIVIDKAVTVESLNGPDVTLLVGCGVGNGGTNNGTGAVRCAYIGSGARLSGFTLTNGYTHFDFSPLDGNGGGAWCKIDGVISNCVISGNSSFYAGAGVYSGTVHDCLISGNASTIFGGGAAYSTLRRCMLSRNSASSGGGAFSATLDYCCVTSNRASQGAGVCEGSARHSTLNDNFATGGGGGAFNAALQNCSLYGNSSLARGGGTCTDRPGGDLRNCTIIGNRATEAGGVYYEGSQVYNSIIYHNTSTSGDHNWGTDHPTNTMHGACTTPLPPGAGNTTNAPGVLGLRNPHLVLGSPCVDAGTNAYVEGTTDIDGDPRILGPLVDIGCDEVSPNGLTGTVTAAISAPFTRAVVDQPLDFDSAILGTANGFIWNFGDGTFATNGTRVEHRWTTSGVYTVVLTAYNNDQTNSAATTVTILDNFTNYVSPSGGHVSPFVTWESAATNIQLAIDASVMGGMTIVTNGVYGCGSTNVNGSGESRIALRAGAIVQSVNGPDATILKGTGTGPGATNTGDGAVRCAYLCAGSQLIGFTLTNGYTKQYGTVAENAGGGAWCEHGVVISNCVISGNSASYCGRGGGSYWGAIQACRVFGNSAGVGGGVYNGVAENSEIFGNWAMDSGGGVFGGAVLNCVVSSNQAASAGGGSFGAFVKQCMIVGNSSGNSGGGANRGIISESKIVGNSARWNGGGTVDTTNMSCLIIGNKSEDRGGGAGSGHTFCENCTIVGNTATVAGGGAWSGRLRNCVVYYNVSSNGANAYQSNLEYCCTTDRSSVGGSVGNVTNAPLFVDMVGSDCRLSATSPCIDAGINQDWMVDGMDVDGAPRIRNERVDIGAYETPFTLYLRALLQGSYDTNAHAMAFGHPAIIPFTSPYATDPRVVSSIPSNAVDWVLVELVGTNGATVVSKSAFLETGGQLLAADGSTGITAEVSAGYYSVVLKHRNHLAAMSAGPVAFTNILTTYDFTTGSDKYLGGAGAAVELESNVWGLIAGDADGDGAILPVDVGIYSNQMGQVGYRRADLNLDGTVDGEDLALLTANAGRQSGATATGTPLSGGLAVSPQRKTVLSGTSFTLTALNASNAVNWALVENPSGGLLSPSSITSVVYTAGSVSNCVDIVQAQEGDRLGRAWVNVISSNDVAGAGRAIVVAGGKGPSDPLAPVTDYLGDLAYNTLLYRGYAKDNVRYLNPVTEQDVDGNGAFDDVAAATTLASAAGTFTNWAMASTDKLFIYLVDHGGTESGNGYFRLNGEETLTAVQLDAWLDQIQDARGNEMVVVLDFCEAGSFLEPLKRERRTVIAACGAGEPTYFVAGGLVSFSDAFFGAVVSGLDLAEAFGLARDAMGSYQGALADADGSGGYAPSVDPPLMAGVYLGPSFIAGKDIPQIGHVMGGQLLQGDTAATLWAYDIVSAYPLDRVWCMVVPPGHDPDPQNPVADLPTLDLSYNATTGRYEAQYAGFTELGTYKLVYYARDIWGSVSLPRPSFVEQAGYGERMIVVAGGSTNDAQWSAVSRLAAWTYQTALARRLGKPALRYLSAGPAQDLDGDGSNDVYAAATIASVAEAITLWPTNAHRLNVYLLGSSTTNGQCRLNPTESLPASQLDGWLDAFQASNTAALVVMDFDGCGGYVPELKPPAERERIVVASARAGSARLCALDGVYSFSRFFLSGIFNGKSVGAAFAFARDAIKSASGRLRQTPQLDDSGNGVPDEKKLDGTLSAQRYIGAAFATGAEAPFIGSVGPTGMVVVGEPVTLWADEVVGDAGISNVWCAISGPDYDGTGDPPQTNLVWNAATGRYEALYLNLTLPGTYACTFFALDNEGQLSASVLSLLIAADAYEPDDTNTTATIFPSGETQARNFHAAADEDWVAFYAPTGYVFEALATQLGTNSDLVLDLYYEWPDGSLEWVDGVDLNGEGPDETEALTLDLKLNPFDLQEGIYFLRVGCADTNLFGPGSDYTLKVWNPTGSGGVVTLNYRLPETTIGKFYVSLGPSGALAAGAAWRIPEADNKWHSDPDPLYVIWIPHHGDWHLAFQQIEGFTAPPGQTLKLDDNDPITVPGTYTPIFSFTNPVPQVVSMSMGAGGVFQFQCIAKPGNRYAIEQSTNLIHWTPLGTNLVPSDGALPFSITNDPHQPRAFYRWRLVE